MEANLRSVRCNLKGGLSETIVCAMTDQLNTSADELITEGDYNQIRSAQLNAVTRAQAKKV